MQNEHEEVKEESEGAKESSPKQPARSQFNEAEYKRWWEGLKAIRFPDSERA